MLAKFWAESPSVDDLFAAWVGYRPADAEPEFSSEQDLLTFAWLAGGLGGIGHG